LSKRAAAGKPGYNLLRQHDAMKHHYLPNSACHYISYSQADWCRRLSKLYYSQMYRCAE